MAKLYGFYVTRAKHGKCEKPVWSGLTKEGRESHKHWIIETVSNLEYDGLTSFVDIESEVIITAEGYYKDNRDRIIRICHTDGSRYAHGYIQTKTKTGKLKDKTLVHYWINGQALYSDSFICSAI